MLNTTLMIANGASAASPVIFINVEPNFAFSTSNFAAEYIVLLYVATLAVR